MSLRICVYTTIIGGYDDLKPQPAQTLPCDFICLTDEPLTDNAVPPWRVVQLDHRIVGTGSDQLKARFAKVQSHLVLQGLDQGSAPDRQRPYDITIWIDASVSILRPNFVEEMIQCLGDHPIASIKHPDRDCIFDDAEASLDTTAHKYEGMLLRDQVEHYRSEGYPAHYGLVANGVLVRNMRHELVPQIDEAWWAEISGRSTQDQLSLPYVLWKLGARAGALDVNLWRNPLFEVWPHLDPRGDDLALRARGEYNTSFAPREGGDKIALYLAAREQWILPSEDSTQARRFLFGPSGENLVPLMGDWDGDGWDSPGLYCQTTGTFYLRNECVDGSADHVFSFGPPGLLPVTGDWDSDGRDGVGIFDKRTGYWALTNRLEPGKADTEFQFGAPGTPMLPIAGDWTGRGRDLVGLYEPTFSSWFLSKALSSDSVDHFDFGPSRGLPVVGDWDGDGTDKVGVFIPEQGQAFLARSNKAASPCWRVLIDPLGARPVPGRWLVQNRKR